jgi:hypothetical protein
MNDIPTRGVSPKSGSVTRARADPYPYVSGVSRGRNLQTYTTWRDVTSYATYRTYRLTPNESSYVVNETDWLIKGWVWILNNPNNPNHGTHFAAWFARFAKHEQTHPGAFAAAAREVRW